MHDSRQALATLFTASVDKYIAGMQGATLANYTEFKDFIKNDQGKITGLVVQDSIAKKEIKINSKVVINCTGANADELRLKDNPNETKRIVPSRGTHLFFPKDLASEYTGIIVPQTTDGRLIFVINYMGHFMAGTTDEKCENNDHPVPP